MLISSRDSLAQGWQEEWFEAYSYANPYKALASKFETLYKNNPQWKYQPVDKSPPLGTLVLKDSGLAGNKPKFAHVVCKPFWNPEIQKDVPEDVCKDMDEAQHLHPNVLLGWLKVGIQKLKTVLIPTFPITRRI